MANQTISWRSDKQKLKISQTSHLFVRVGKYFFWRLLTISLTIVCGVFFTVVIANRGGFIDAVVEQDVIDRIFAARYSGIFDNLSEAQREQAYDRLLDEFSEQAGLKLAFFPRHLRWTANVLTFQWGDVLNKANIKLASYIRMSGRAFIQSRVMEIILKRFPNTLLLIVSANLLVFLFGIPLALYLSRRDDSWLDKTIGFLSPISSIPSWVHGLFLIILFAIQLRVLPFGGMYDLVPPPTKWGYIPVIFKHMLLPVIAIFLSIFFQCIYNWRTFFLIYADEDYVDLAKAKGLPNRILERRYIFRPTLPYVLTSFTMTLLGFWQMTTALEFIFAWPGIGLLYIEALGVNVTEKRIIDAVLIIGIVVIFAYLMGLTVLLLDLINALIDPRIHIGNNKEQNVSRGGMYKKGLLDRLKEVLQSQPKPSYRSKSSIRKKSTGKKVKRRSFETAAIHTFFFRLSEITRYPMLMITSVLVILLIVASVYTVVVLPPSQVTKIWHRVPAGYEIAPQNAQPVWFNWFLRTDLPPTIIRSSWDNISPPTIDEQKIDRTPGFSVSFNNHRYFLPFIAAVQSERDVTTSTLKTGRIELSIEYPYHVLPQDLVIYFFPQYQQKKPFVSLTWITPDGRKFNLGNLAITTGSRYSLAKDIPQKYLFEGIRYSNIFRPAQGGFPVTCALFFDPRTKDCATLPGQYLLRIDTATFEPDSWVEAQAVLYGEVHGIAGTDADRRDLSIGLLWGFPIAMAYGLVGALVTTLLSLMLAAAAAWYNGWVDALIQRLTEANMILPVLAIGVLVYYNYGISFWLILAIVVLLNIFGSTTKAYRAAFLQIKEAPYIEAARDYNASNSRIIFRYLVPRILPVLIPQLITQFPVYIFLEATLGLFGVGDPFLPTWGSIIHDSISGWAFREHFYWIAEPISLVLITSLIFTLFGIALNRLLNPRSRGL